jgi:hypothetical protein
MLKPAEPQSQKLKEFDMTKQELLRLIQTILVAEGKQHKRGRVIQTCINSQVRAVNKLAEAVGITEAVTENEISELTF